VIPAPTISSTQGRAADESVSVYLDKRLKGDRRISSSIVAPLNPAADLLHSRRNEDGDERL